MEKNNVQFGFLNKPISLSFDKYKIIPVENYAEHQKYVSDNTHRDGYFYPPTQEGQYCFPYRWWEWRLPKWLASLYIKIVPDVFKYKKVPNTVKPADIFKNIPPSHKIEFESKNIDLESHKKNELSLIIYLISYFYDTTLRFTDWGFDGKISYKYKSGLGSTDKLERLLKHALDEFKKLDDYERILLINILYMYSRIYVYFWEWEQFVIAYMTIDACWKYLVKTKTIVLEKQLRHGERLKKMCEDFDLFYDKEYIERIIKTRNDLFHEGLWLGGLPGFNNAKNKEEVDIYILYVRRLIQRLILVSLNYDIGFVRTSWMSRGRYAFE